MNETAKKAIYAAVGAPVVTARWVGERMAVARDTVGDRATKLAERIGEDARKEFEIWAEEGEKIVTRLSEQPVVEDFAARVDLDQIQGQVHRIRGQLDEVVEAWRESFRPQKEAVEVKPAKTQEAKPAAKKPAAKPAPKAAKPAGKAARPAPTPRTKPAAKKAAAKPAAKSKEAGAPQPESAAQEAANTETK